MAIELNHTIVPATAAAFLASDDAAWITGVVVDVAGCAVLV